MLQDIMMVWFLTMGVFALTKEQMPFEFWQKIAYDSKLNSISVLFEPLTECLCCMASFWTCVWFGYCYQFDWVVLAFHFWLLNIILGFSIGFGRAIDVDFFSKIMYFALVASFIFFLPSHHKEAVICMVSVVGINYHLGRIIDRCKD